MNKKQSCDRCHRRKEQCLGTTPCTRCHQNAAECCYTRVAKKRGRPKVSAPEKLPVRGKYSKNGCVPCRRAKKKCDEDRPYCKGCQRRARPCWYGDTLTEPSSIGPKSPVPPLPVPAAAEAAKPAISTVTEPSKLPTPARSDWLLLLPGVNVDDSLFSFTERMFLNSLLREQMSSSLPASSDNDLYEEQKFDLLTLCMLNSVGIAERERVLLCHFISDVSPLLFADKTTTRFLRTVVPLCLVDHRVRYPVLAIAASHRLSLVSDYEAHRESVLFQGMSQTCMVGKNDDFHDDTENVLLSLCLQCVQEIFEGRSLYWSSALEKGAEVIRVRGGLKKVSRKSPLSIQLFCYLDHISSLSTCATPFVDRTKNDVYEDYDGNFVEDILNCKFGFKFGMAGDLFKIVGNISTLASLRPSRYKSLECERQFDSLATLIEMKLQNWLPPLPEWANTYAIDEKKDQRTLSAYLLTLQWSCFVRLHQIRHGYNRRDERVVACLDNILKSLKLIEQNSGLETSLLFPLIMAGLVTYKEHDRNYIIGRIRSIKDKLRFGYIGEFEKLLLTVWSRDSVDGDLVNWAKIRYYEFPGLVMF